MYYSKLAFYYLIEVFSQEEINLKLQLEDGVRAHKVEKKEVNVSRVKHLIQKMMVQDRTSELTRAL